MSKLPYLIASTLLLANAASAAIYTVGPSGTGCQFTTIQAAINAAASNPGADEIRISNASSITGQALTIGTQDVTLDGGYATCTSSAPNGDKLFLRGNLANSVMQISGSGVRVVKNIVLVDGRTTQYGGGINFQGTGELVLERATVAESAATIGGGGVSVLGSGGGAVLRLLSGVEIATNATAGSGAGILLRANATLSAEVDDIQIYANNAQQLGGGVHISDATARAFIGSPGNTSTFSRVIYDNIASDGGGVSLNDGILNVFSTVANRPTTLSANRARNRGGALYVASGTGRACFNNFLLDRNSAQQGSAIYNEGQVTSLNDDDASDCVPLGAPAVNCTPRNINGCNVINLHFTQTEAGARTAGATIYQDGNSNISRLRMRDMVIVNGYGGNVIRTNEVTEFSMSTTLISYSGSTADPNSGPLIRLNFGSSGEPERLQLNSNTIANNFFNTSQVFQFEDGPDQLNFNHNLIWQPGKTLLTLPFPIANSANYNWNFNAGNDVAILPAPWNSATSNPRFIFPEGNNFRLRVGSPLVDRYPNISPFPVFADADGRARPVDLPLKGDVFSFVDPGAYETQITDDYILNGRFDGNLIYWSTAEAPAGSVTWDAADSGTAPGTGSARVAITSAQIPSGTLRMNALSYCFNVPGNGLYTVSARGFRNGGFNTDNPVLRWRVRENSENCGGPATREGDAFFVAGSGWQNLAALQIPIAFSNITNTTIELRMDVAEGNPALSTSTGLSAGFDNIVMTGTSIEDVFKNGFE